MDRAVDVITTPIGRYVLAASERGLTHIAPASHAALEASDRPSAQSQHHLERARSALAAYFAGTRQGFGDLALDAAGTAFQQRVWKALGELPFGTTLSYGELAQRIGRHGAARAVGAANGSNPLAIVVPCHRVLGADGSLTGYAHGIERKRWLLDHEAANGCSSATRPRESLAGPRPVRVRASA